MRIPDSRHPKEQTLRICPESLPIRSLPIRVTANPFTTHAHPDEQAGSIPFDNTE